MDMYFSIDRKRYHCEFQMKEDAMAIRMFRYGIRAALKDSENCIGNRYDLKVILPYQAVVFLAGKNKKENITIVQHMMGGMEACITIPCVSVGKDIDELIKEKLYLFIPFQQVRYNDKMNAIGKRSEKSKKKMADELFDIHKKVCLKLEWLKNEKEITNKEYEYLYDAFLNIERYLLDKDEYVKKEVKGMGDEEYVFWSDRCREEGRAEGREEGRAEGIRNSIKTILKIKGIVSRKMEDMLDDISDDAELQRLLIISSTATTVEEFEDELEKELIVL